MQDAAEILVPTPAERTASKGLRRLAERYLKWMGTMNYSPGTIRVRTLQLNSFLAWCDEHNLQLPRSITRKKLERYVRHVAQARATGTRRHLTTSAQHGRLVAVRSFFKWLSRKKLIPHNPASELDLPKMERRLPKVVLSHRQIENILALPDTSTPLGLRDRAMLETFYCTGLRRAELIALKIDEVYIERGFLLVNQGKGKKDRVVPIGERAIEWIQRYLEQVRPQLVRRRVRHHLFLSVRGNPLTPTGVSIVVRDYLTAAGVTSRGACHMFRHSMATAMLENGADIRFIQEMLGHADLKTTQIYTHVNPVLLKQVHAATHPALKAS